ncbi:MAG: hypothetical protein IT269_12340 [Saprospiraceae bacterium]|nr:hypothetical protein [Saprospiraceae bacterium]
MAKSKKWLESKWKSGKTKDSSKNKTTENKKKGKAVLVLLIVLFSLILLFAGLFLFALHTLYPVDPDETRPYFMMAIGSILGLIITGIKLRRLNKPEAETRTKPIRKVN